MTARLVLATANAGKRRELERLLGDLGSLGYVVESLVDHPGVQLPPEGAISYAANAMGKARAVAAAVAGAAALGDDSGLEVDLLGGRPGVASARYGGPGLGDAERTTRLLLEVAQAAATTPGPGDGRERRARFRCALALVAPWGEEALVEDTVEGVLSDAPRGTGGFGYDPIFFLPALGRTMAELRPDEKAAWSHRGRAVRAARPILVRWARRISSSSSSS